MKRINNNAIIATDQEMVDAGLFECKPDDGIIRLWLQRKNTETGRWGFMPIVEVTESLVPRDQERSEYGRMVRASTHMIEDYYVSLEPRFLNLQPLLDDAGVKYQPLTCNTRFIYGLEYESGRHSSKLFETREAAVKRAIMELQERMHKGDNYIKVIQIDTYGLVINNFYRLLNINKNL